MADQIVDIISKLGVDATDVYAEIDKVNAKYGQSNAALREQKLEMSKLLAEEKKLIQARNASNNPTIVAQLNKELEKTRTQINLTNTAIKQNSAEIKKSTQEASKLNKELNQAFDKTQKRQATGSGIGSLLGGLVAGFGAVSFGQEVISITGKFEKFASVLENTLGSSSAAKQALDDIKTFAEQTPFSVEELTESFVKLANQGFVPTTAELRKLGDIASSQGKSFNQLTEAIIDAQTGEFERLKEFGIRAQKEGDKVAFTFKGVKTQTDFTNESIREYILNLGDAQGVSGSMAAISETLEGQISNLGDTWDNFLVTVGTKTKPVISGAITALKSLLEGAKGFISDIADLVSGNIGDSTNQTSILKNTRVLTEQDAKRLVELGFDIKERYNLSDEEKNVLNFAEALKLYVNRVKEVKGETEITKAVLSGFKIEYEKLNKAQKEGTISQEDYIVKAGLLSDAVAAVNEAQKAYNTTQNKTKELTKEELAELEKLAKFREAQAKKLRDLEISNIQDDFAKQRALAVAKYNDEFKLAKGNTDLIAELRRQLDFELEKIDKAETERIASERKKQREIEEKNFIARQERLAKEKEERQNDQNEALDEAQRHQTALLEIRTTGEEDQEAILLANQIAFERARLDQYERFYGQESEQYIQQKNKVIELEEKYSQKLKSIDAERTQRIIENTKAIVDSVISATNQILASEEKRVDKLISLQEKRVEQTRAIAENGNAELLELEQKRLNDLTKQREKYVRAQQALAAVELIANTAVTVSKAASQGGAAAAVTIAAALIALVAGLASARSIAGQAAYFSGGETDGYTGNGSIYDESNAVGRKPYIYHKKEFIFNNEKTSKYIDIFRGVHKGEIDLNKIKFESDMYKALKANGIDTSRDINLKNYPAPVLELSALKSSLNEIVEAVNAQKGMSVSIDENGIAAITNKFYKNKKRINSIS